MITGGNSNLPSLTGLRYLAAAPVVVHHAAPVLAPGTWIYQFGSAGYAGDFDLLGVRSVRVRLLMVRLGQGSFALYLVQISLARLLERALGGLLGAGPVTRAALIVLFLAAAALASWVACCASERPMERVLRGKPAERRQPVKQEIMSRR